MFDASCSNRIEKVKTYLRTLRASLSLKKGGKYMNAVIKVGGKQYYVTEGSEIFVEKLECEAGDVVNFDQVLMLDSKVGNPYLTNATVQGEVLKNGKAKKIKVFKYKSKDRSNRKTQGHRQPYTKIKITKING
jgi:large subunit ribosomal protein L21